MGVWEQYDKHFISTAEWCYDNFHNHRTTHTYTHTHIFHHHHHSDMHAYIINFIRFIHAKILKKYLMFDMLAGVGVENVYVRLLFHRFFHQYCHLQHHHAWKWKREQKLYGNANELAFVIKFNIFWCAQTCKKKKFHSLPPTYHFLAQFIKGWKILLNLFLFFIAWCYASTTIIVIIG